MKATGTGNQSSHALIAHQNVGTLFEGVYCVESCFIKLTVQQKKYTDLMLRDKSGSRNVKFWGVVDDLTSGDFVAVEARVEDYQGSPSVIATKVSKVNEPSDLSDYIPTIENLKELSDRLAELVDVVAKLDDSTGDKTCTLLLGEAFGNSAFFDKFVSAPGDESPTYGKVGGLLLGTVNVANSALAFSESYGLSDKEQTAMLTAALLHRLGAVDAFHFENCLPKQTKKGILFGLDFLTTNRISAVVRKVSQDAKTNNQSISQEIIQRVVHSIASCGSKSVLPVMKESIVLDSVFRADRTMTDALNFIAADLNINDEFTAFDPRSGRKYYRG